MNDVTQYMSHDHSIELGALAKALSQAQAELQDAKKDSINPHFKSRFASLASVRAAITPTFSKHGLSVAQYNEPCGDKGVCVVTLLMHESGQWLKGRLYVPVVKQDPQGFGSAISYARRYALGEIANIATDDDDDAELASKPAPAKAPPAKAEPVDIEALSRALTEAKTAKELADAAVAIGRVKDKLSDGQLAALRGIREEREKELAA